jgi:hypothetical protein
MRRDRRGAARFYRSLVFSTRCLRPVRINQTSRTRCDSAISQHASAPVAARVCWGADIAMIVALNQDRLRALDAQMWNIGVPFHVRL